MNALTISEDDLVELRLLRDRLRQDARRDADAKGSRFYSSDSIRQAERWLAVIKAQQAAFTDL